jgi:hypothetical protein
VALLNTFGEDLGASPYDYKEAVVAGSNPLPGLDHVDQGAGFIEAAAAVSALKADSEIGSDHPGLSNGYSARSARPKGTLLQDVNDSGGNTFDISLAPGMSEYFYFQLHPSAERVTIDFSNVDLGSPDYGLNSFEVYLQGGAHGYLNPYVDTSGASLNSPEIAVIDSDSIDRVFVLVDAFNTYGKDKMWQLDVTYK